MITEDYVSFEIAKLLKEKGFGETIDHCYDLYSFEFMHHCAKHGGQINAPTLQMAMKWLREVHKLFIQVCIVPHTTVTMEQKYYLFIIRKDRRTLAFRKDFPSEYYFTYEQACEAAIKYCLENLI